MRNWYDLYMVEAKEPNCDAMRQVMAKNEIEYRLDCKSATAVELMAWASTVDHIDALDFDVQGFEYNLLGQKNVIAMIEAKVRRLIIGTHFPRSSQLRLHKSAFPSWPRV